MHTSPNAWALTGVVTIQKAMDAKPKKNESPAPQARKGQPLPKGKPLTREQAIERMYRKYGKAFEALSK
jgi:hypothetical protein